MPRKARIDAPGALHHVIARGIERRKIFSDDADCDNFLERLRAVIDGTRTQCFAWALIPNHFHILLKTGDMPIATVMQRLLTGYAISFNRRHRRSGHLFQNRYKSILCQEDIYLLELVRYIHLNPLRAKLAADLEDLEKYAYCGHSAVMGKSRHPWQNTDYVLKQFASQRGLARRRYKAFVEEGIEQGNRSDLVGGGLLRSVGGWAGVKALRESGDYQKGDERILGDGDFVEKVLATASERMERKYRIQARGLTLDDVVRHVANTLTMNAQEVMSLGKYRRVVHARSIACYWAVSEAGIKQADLVRRFHLSPAAISMSIVRGRDIVEKNGFKFLK